MDDTYCRYYLADSEVLQGSQQHVELEYRVSTGNIWMTAADMLQLASVDSLFPQENRILRQYSKMLGMTGADM